MSNQESTSDESALLRDILTDFLERASKDAAVPTHVLEALQKHFSAKKSISAPEVKATLATQEEVS